MKLFAEFQLTSSISFLITVMAAAFLFNFLKLCLCVLWLRLIEWFFKSCSSYLSCTPWAHSLLKLKTLKLRFLCYFCYCFGFLTCLSCFRSLLWTLLKKTIISMSEPKCFIALNLLHQENFYKLFNLRVPEVQSTNKIVVWQVWPIITFITVIITSSARPFLFAFSSVSSFFCLTTLTHLEVLKVF